MHTLTTARLILRAPRAEDAAALVAIANDWEVAKQTASLPHPYELRHAEQWIAGQTGDRRMQLQHVLCTKDGTVVGVATVYEKDTNTEIGYFLGRAYWNRGYAGEAVPELVRHAFAVLPIRALHAWAFVENEASHRVLRKAGFRICGDFEGDHPERGGWRRVLRFVVERPRKLVLVAAAALLDATGQVLLAQRPPGKSMAGLWEFPGGKVAAGESPEVALARELDEELGIVVRVEELTPLSFASHAYDDFHLLMPLYVCRVWRGELQSREGQRLKWVAPDAIVAAELPPADVPLLGPLRDLVRGRLG